MTNDELLAKMLDGTITPAEKSLLTSEALKNATLAEAIEQLQRVETLLAQSPHSYSAATEEFLRSIEDEIAEKVRDNRRKPVPILPPYIDTKWNWNILLYSVSAILTVGAAGYFGYTALTTGKKATTAPSPTVVVAQPSGENPQAAKEIPMTSTPGPTTAPAQPTYGKVIPKQGTLQTAPDMHAASKTDVPNTPILTTPQTDNRTSAQTPANPLPTAALTPSKNAETIANNGSREVEGSAASEGSIKRQQKRTELLALLAEKRSGGDKVGEMTLNKQIGMLYSSDGKHDEAVKYLEAALAHSRSINSRNDEGIILGEIGLLESKFGNKDLAVSKLQQAIDILTKAGMNHDKLSRELTKLTR